MITEIIDTLKYQTLLEEFEEEYDIELNGELIVAMARVDLTKLKKEDQEKKLEEKRK